MKTIITNSLEETKKIAKDLAQNFKGGVIALSGELGAGKTSFTQGFAEALGIKDKIISPTFVLMRQHQIPNSKNTLYHIDLYRLDSEDDFKQLGFNDLISNPENIIIVEWADKMKDLLPKNTLFIYFEVLDDNKRKVTIKTTD